VRPYSKNPSQKRAGGMAKGVGPKFNLNTKKKKKKKKEAEAGNLELDAILANVDISRPT
jgi:hypothetical protein